MKDRTVNPGTLDLNLLWALDALLRERHVSRAADAVGLGQPAMSAALKRLRLLFQDELLVRQGNRYVLTPLAAELQGQTHTVISDIGRLFTYQPTYDPATSERTFVICTTEYPNDVLVPRIVETVLSRAPSVSVDIWRLGPNTTEDFESGLIDILIQPCPEQTERGISPTAAGAPVFRDRWVCVVSADNPEVGDRLTPEQYRDLAQVGYGAEGRPRPTQKVLEWCEPRIVDVWTHSFLSISQLVRGTRMFSIVPVQMANILIRSGDVRLVELPLETPGLEYWMYWNVMFETDPGNAWLRGLVAECAQPLDASPQPRA